MDRVEDRAPGRFRMLALLAVAELLAMTLWFSASAVGPELAALWGLSGAQTAWLTNAVQLGFVVEAVLSAALTVSDTVRPRYLFAVSVFGGAAATAVIALSVESFLPAVGWQWAFAPLVVGPLVGTAAMVRLRSRPEASALAGGRG